MSSSTAPPQGEGGFKAVSNFSYKTAAAQDETKKPFEGVLPNLERRYARQESTWVREGLGKYMSDSRARPVTASGLKARSPAVQNRSMDISGRRDELSRILLEHFERAEKPALYREGYGDRERILKEITDRAGNSSMPSGGLSWTMRRGSGSLSAVKGQRISAIASQSASGILTGVLYVA